MAIKHIHVLGQGAIGSMLLARAIKQGLSCSSAVRNKQSCTETVYDLDGKPTALLPPITLNDALPDGTLVVAPLKAYQLEKALEQLASQVHENTILLLLHNGMLDLTETLKLLPCNVYLATTSHAATRQNREVFVTGAGTTQCGLRSHNSSRIAISEQVAELTQILQQLINPVTFVADVHSVLWRKLIVNACINPLTALHKIKNGELQQPTFTQKILNIIDESLLIAYQDKACIDSHAITQTVFNVIAQTANNHSSMYQDVIRRRPTEIDYINGYIVAKGRLYGLSVTHNLGLMEQIKQLCNS